MSNQNQLSNETVDRLFNELSADVKSSDNAQKKSSSVKTSKPRTEDSRTILPRSLAVEAAIRKTG